MSVTESSRKQIVRIKTWVTTRPRWVRIALVTALVLAAGWGLYAGMGTKGTGVQYETEQIERGTLVVAVTASGTVSSANNAAVSTNASGVVTQVYATNNDVVEAGQAIAEITLDQSSEQKRAAAYASYMSAVQAEKNAEQAKLSADAQMWGDQKAVLDAQNTVDSKNNNTTNPSTKKEYTDLEKQSIESALVGARKQFSASEQKYLIADAAISAAKASLTSAWLAYQQTSPVITAPISGTLSGLSLRPGSVITSSNSSSSDTNAGGGSASQVATIRTEGKPLVTVNLSEIDVPTVHVGDKATVTIDALSGKSFTGSVISIDTSGSVSSGVTTYTTVIQFDTEAPDVYSNMAANASIITQTKDNVLLIPSTAVQTQNGQATVRVMKNGNPQTVNVEVGASSDSQTEVVSGLSEGDVVITSSSASTSQTSSSSSPFSTFGGRGMGGANIRIAR